MCGQLCANSYNDNENAIKTATDLIYNHKTFYIIFIESF